MGYSVHVQKPRKIRCQQIVLEAYQAAVEVVERGMKDLQDNGGRLRELAYLQDQSGKLRSHCARFMRGMAYDLGEADEAEENEEESEEETDERGNGHPDGSAV